VIAEQEQEQEEPNEHVNGEAFTGKREKFEYVFSKKNI